MNSLDRFDWTDDNLANMEKWWAEGLSARTIAAQLGHGCTRNAVLGKIHRKRAANGHVPVPQVRQPRAPRPVPVRLRTPSLPAVAKPVNGHKPRLLPIAEPAAALLDGNRITVLHLSDKTCRWPIGDPGSHDFCFCGNRPETAPPYCDYHTRVASNGFPTRTHRSATVDRRWLT